MADAAILERDPRDSVAPELRVCSRSLSDVPYLAEDLLLPSLTQVIADGAMEGLLKGVIGSVDLLPDDAHSAVSSILTGVDEDNVEHAPGNPIPPDRVPGLDYNSVRDRPLDLRGRNATPSQCLKCPSKIYASPPSELSSMNSSLPLRRKRCIQRPREPVSGSEARCINPSPPPGSW